MKPYQSGPYYFVNDSRQEFCSFTNSISIVKALNDALTYNVGWHATDSIHIGSDKVDEATCLMYLDSKRYTHAKMFNTQN